MNTIPNTSITDKDMIDNGWEKSSDPTYLFNKKIPNRNPLNASEDSDLHLTVHCLFNSWQFAVVMPDGGFLNFTAKNIEELCEFESRINFYDPPF